MTFPTLADAAIAGAAASGGNVFLNLVLPFAAMAAVMYFLIIRPQQQQRKKHAEMIEAIKKGDMIVTAGGIIGKVTKVADDELTLEIGDAKGVRVSRNMIASVRSKTEPVAAND